VINKLRNVTFDTFSVIIGEKFKKKLKEYNFLSLSAKTIFYNRANAKNNACKETVMIKYKCLAL
jgi:hypothetical protein